MAKNALLFYPPQHCHKNFFKIWTFNYSCYFPMALLKLSTYLKQQGYGVTYLDAFNIFDYETGAFEELFTDSNIVRSAPYGNYKEEKREDPIYHIGYTYSQIKSRLLGLPVCPDEVYISSLFTWTWQTTHDSIALIKEVFPNTRVKLGGIYPTLCPQKAKSSGADEIFEGTVAEIQNCWLDKEILASEGHLTDLPFKASLGCPNKCSYCSVRLLEGRKIDYRDSEDIIHEINSFHKEFGLDIYQFWDSNPLIKPETHLFKIVEKLKKTNPNLHFLIPGGIQPNLLTPEIALTLKKLGCIGIRLTIETTEKKRMKESGRPATLFHLETALDNLTAAGYSKEELSVVLLIGQPGQTVDTVLTDIINVYRYEVNIILFIYTPIPGTADFTTYQELFQDRSLEDLDPLLYPLASPRLNTRQIDLIIEHFNGKYVPLDSIINSSFDDPVINRMKELLLEKENSISE